MSGGAALDNFPQEGDDDEVFEINDFTTATPWERFCAKLEESIRQWSDSWAELGEAGRSVEDEDGNMDGKLANSLKEVVSHGGQSYELIGHVDDTTLLIDEKGLNGRLETYGQLTDFSAQLGRLQRWFGVTSYVMLKPLGSAAVERGEASMLLGALNVACQNCHLPLPCFVHVFEEQDGTILGFFDAPSVGIRYRSDSLDTASPSYQHLSGLLDLFSSKLGLSNALQEKVSVSVRFTYKSEYSLPEADEYDGEMYEEEEDLGTLLRKRQHRINWVPTVGGCLWEPDDDPVETINLATSWLHFPSPSLVENSVYTQLESGTAPFWALRCKYYKEISCAYAGCIDALRGAISSSKGAASMNDFLGAGEDPQSQFLHALGSIGRTMQSQLLKRRTTAARIDETMGEIFDSNFGMDEHDESTEDDSESRPRWRMYDNSLLAVFAMKMGSLGNIRPMAVLWREFVKELRWHWENGVPLRRCALKLDLSTNLLFQKVTMLNICISRMLLYKQNVPKESDEASEEKKASEDEDQGEASTSPPGRVVRFGENIGAEEAKATSIADAAADLGMDGEAGEGWDVGDDDIFGDEASPRAGGKSGGDSEEDDFFDCEDDAGTASETESVQATPARKLEDRDATPVIATPEQSPQCNPADFATPSADTPRAHQHIYELPLEKKVAEPDEYFNRRKGHMKPLPGLFSVNTNYLLWEPRTQGDVPMTMDTIRQQQDAFTQLGESAEAAQIRARLQSAQLVSDMQAFKGANPDCCIHDFIRWHSPRDWSASPWPDVPDDELDIPGLGYVSNRMRGDNNIWKQCWESAVPLMAVLQRPLFDHEKEAEVVFHFLENIFPEELLDQLLDIVLRSTVNFLTNLPSNKLPVVARHTSGLADVMRALDEEVPAAAVAEEFTDALAETECMSMRAMSLLEKLRGEFRIVNDLMDSTEAAVKTEEERRCLREIFCMGKSSSQGKEGRVFPSPDAREYLFRSLAPASLAGSNLVPNRMYALLTPAEFRIAQAFVEEDQFMQPQQ